MWFNSNVMAIIIAPMRLAVVCSIDRLLQEVPKELWKLYSVEPATHACIKLGKCPAKLHMAKHCNPHLLS
jgi:hypothetical protein